MSRWLKAGVVIAGFWSPTLATKVNREDGHGSLDLMNND